MSRDLKVDLEICNRATPGPWAGKFPRKGQKGIRIGKEIGVLDPDIAIDVMKRADAEFIIYAREGWPHAIERCLKAEEEVARLKSLEDGLRNQLVSSDTKIGDLEAKLAKMQRVVDAARLLRCGQGCDYQSKGCECCQWQNSPDCDCEKIFKAINDLQSEQAQKEDGI